MANLLQKLPMVPVQDIAFCTIVEAELFYGASKSLRPTQNLAVQQTFLTKFVSLPFDKQAAIIYGPVRAQLERAGTVIGSNDLLIATIALAHNLTLVTHNTREFSRVASLRLED